jgi:raffinose/stachyose/melibiose transport system substrate-binding protein
MSYKKLMLAAACAITASCSGMTAALADVTVRMLHVEQSPQVAGFWNDIARRYEASHPGVKVDVQYLENEAYKKKLTTLLQSSDRPNIIYSWAGGVLRDQVKAGVIEDLTPVMDAPWKARFVPAAVQAYTVNDKVYGVPMHTAQVGFFYNKDLFAKAGVDASSIKTWDDLLGAVKKFAARARALPTRPSFRQAKCSSNWWTSSRSRPASSERPILNRQASSATARAR